MKNLSGGMRRRVEIARGLVHEPRVFFLDEPTTGLDPVSRTAVWEMLQRIKCAARPDGPASRRTTWTKPTSSATASRSSITASSWRSITPRWRSKASIPGRDGRETVTLDDVFVHYTGHDLRDALQAPSARGQPVRDEAVSHNACTRTWAIVERELRRFRRARC